ncbi:MAG: conserved hypothetical protein partial [Methanobrevibacter sp. CfCl-M3]
MNIFNRLMFVGGFCLFALMLVLISAQVIMDDSGDNKTVTINDTVSNFTTTPHRTNDNTGFITLNINTDKELNKTFTFKHNNQTDYTIDMNDSSSSISYNTPMFNLGDECNETLTLDEFNLTLNTVFHTQETSLLNILNLETRNTAINPNDSIQATIDNASAGDAIELNGRVYYQHDINVTKENLTIKASGNGGVPIINGEGQGRGFNVSSNGVLIQDLTITNTITSDANGGGGVYMSDGGSVSGCNFINTTAFNEGGGIYIGTIGGNGSVSGCSFTNTTVNVGSGVFVFNGSVSGCSFTNTTTIMGYGGGVYINNGGSVSECNFTNTVCALNGGGVYMGGNRGSVSGCNFINSTAGGDGGGVYMGGSGGIVSSGKFKTNHK